MPQVDVITGDPRHRSWTVEEKLSILAAAFAPGAVVREIARRANVSSGQIYTWRKQLMNNNQAGGGFAQVVRAADFPPAAAVAPAASAPQPQAAVTPVPAAAHELPAIELDVRGLKVRIPGTMPPALASVVVRALVRR
ncbi:MAG: transposase [Acetobacteraceae bacterium]|nr:transposase [Acetobacteraceae bacterium]MBV8574357.1 transposase [Acetobacteraceae bacterium]